MSIRPFQSFESYITCQCYTVPPTVILPTYPQYVIKNSRRYSVKGKDSLHLGEGSMRLMGMGGGPGAVGPVGVELAREAQSGPVSPFLKKSLLA